jgi:HlyD family secretion protein
MAKRIVNKTVYGLVAILLIALGVWIFPNISHRSNPLESLPKEEIKKSTFVISIDEMGVFTATRNTLVYSPFRGKVARMVDDGKTVKKGEVIITLDIEQVKDDLEEQISSLKDTKANLERTIEQLVQAMRNNSIAVQSTMAELEFNRLKLIDVNKQLETVELLKEQNVVPKRDVDEASLKVSSSQVETLGSDLSYRENVHSKAADEEIKKSEIQGVKIRGEQAQRKIEEATQKMTRANVVAPATGIFVRMKRWEWHLNRLTSIQEGDEVHERQVMGEMPDLSSLIVESQISEDEITKVHPGLPVEVKVDALDGLVLHGSVSLVGNIAIERERSAAGMITQTEQFSGQKVFEIKINLEKLDDRLRPGMTANVSIVLEKYDNVISIPLSAVFSKDGRKIVYRYTPKGYEEVPVELGKSSRNRVIVLGGLKKNDKIFLKDLSSLESET